MLFSTQFFNLHVIDYKYGFIINFLKFKGAACGKPYQLYICAEEVSISGLKLSGIEFKNFFNYR